MFDRVSLGVRDRGRHCSRVVKTRETIKGKRTTGEVVKKKRWMGDSIDKGGESDNSFERNRLLFFHFFFFAIDFFFSFSLCFPVVYPSFTPRFPLIFPSFSLRLPVVYPSFVRRFPLVRLLPFVRFRRLRKTKLTVINSWKV